MLEQIGITNFKAFARQDIDFPIGTGASRQDRAGSTSGWPRRTGPRGSPASVRSPAHS
jgi:hypothetical protein